jgi:hypothetical protein
MGNGTHFCLPKKERIYKHKKNERFFILPFLLRVRGVFGCDETGCSSLASARLGQSFGFKKLKYTKKKNFKIDILLVEQQNQVVYL